ncbi:hypothetical protein [Leptospira interrogans]|uniref:hypothetical protein n=1 Tax=Leptospira interrogans TaxID=173 RepID=UPI001E553629|nr:hypothetical protein [Leptospira interrogans]
MVREIGRVNSAKRFPELKSRASYGPRDRVALTQQNAFLNSNLALPMVREIGRVNSVNAFLNSNLALPMVREIGSR